MLPPFLAFGSLLFAAAADGSPRLASWRQRRARILALIDEALEVSVCYAYSDRDRKAWDQLFDVIDGALLEVLSLEVGDLPPGHEGATSLDRRWIRLARRGIPSVLEKESDLGEIRTGLTVLRLRLSNPNEAMASALVSLGLQAEASAATASVNVALRGAPIDPGPRIEIEDLHDPSAALLITTPRLGRLNPRDRWIVTPKEGQELSPEWVFRVVSAIDSGEPVPGIVDDKVKWTSAEDVVIPKDTLF
jgi:hypothetical protein